MLCRQSKNIHYQKFFTENSWNAKNTWKDIKSIININSTMKTEPTSLMVNNDLISDPKEIANTFNSHFSTTAKELQDNIYHNGQDFTKYLTNRNEHELEMNFITPTDKHEICNLINNIEINKATGPHSIPSNTLHLIKINISKPLSDIINLSFEKGVYFDNLKISKTIPAFKEKGSNLECNNYRPISLLSNINKIIEMYLYVNIINVHKNVQFSIHS